MDILYTFKVYQKELDNIRKKDYYGRPQVLRQFRMQFNGFSKADIEILKSFLLDGNKKWFVAHLLDNLDTFPAELLKPMLTAAVNEHDPSFNNEFINPCRRVFDYVEIQEILLDIFQNGDAGKKIGVLKALYWVKRTVYLLAVQEGNKVYQQKGHDTFFWDYELKAFNEDFKEDEELFNREAPRQEEAYKMQVRTLIEAYYNTHNRELKYQIALRLPNTLKDYPTDLQGQAANFLSDKEQDGIPNNISELDRVQNVKNSFFRRLILLISKKLVKKGNVTLKQK